MNWNETDKRAPQRRGPRAGAGIGHTLMRMAGASAPGSGAAHRWPAVATTDDDDRWPWFQEIWQSAGDAVGWLIERLACTLPVERRAIPRIGHHPFPGPSGLADSGGAVLGTA